MDKSVLDFLTEQEKEDFAPFFQTVKKTQNTDFIPLFSDSETPQPKLSIQQELFSLDPIHEKSRQAYFSLLPKSIADFLAVKLKKRIASYGSMYANQWLNEQKGVLRERMAKVLSQYGDVLDIFSMPYQDLTLVETLPFNKSLWKKTDTDSESEKAARLKAKVAEAVQIFPSLNERLEKHRAIFQREHLTPLYKMNGVQIKRFADVITEFISNELNIACTAVLPTIDEPEQAFFAMLKIYQNLSSKLTKLSLPIAEVKDNAALVTALLKITDPKTWERKFTQMAKRQREHLAIAVGMVHANLGGYVSNERLREFQEQKKANFEFIKNCLITNSLNEEEQHELLDIWLKSSANPKINRIELMARIKGYEETAEVEGDQGVFVTLTAPSAYHAMLQTGGYNPKWNGSSPSKTQGYLCQVWARIRSALKRREIQIYGLRVAEPHHDATPHFHFVLWTKPEHMRELKRIIYQYALAEDGNEKGAKRNRCKFKMIDKNKGSATGYVVKYVSKNIDAKGMDDLFSDETGRSAKESAARSKAWSSLWRIRQFQFIGGATVGVYRELRRLGDKKAQDETTEIVRVVSDLGEYACYLREQGGVHALRKDQRIKLHYIETEPNKYEEVRKKVDGVENCQNGVFTKTRLKEWVIGRKSSEWKRKQAEAERIAKEKQDKELCEKAGLPALGLVSVTVRSTEIEQYSQEFKESIKNTLLIRRGRATDYDVDDLLRGKWLKISSSETENIYLRYANRQLLEERTPKIGFFN